MRLHWNVGVRSDVGLAREGNEDSLYAGPRLLAVADGVGGSAAGEIASTIAVNTLAPLDAEAAIRDPLAALADAIRAANDELRTAIEANPSLTGMGTTLTALLWADDSLGLAQLGDSRAYRLRGETFEQISRDQTLVQSLVDEGEITAEEALTHPRRSWILQALDGRPDSQPALEILETQTGDRYLLCSDGLSDYVALHDITDAIQIRDPQQACDRMIDLALAAGAPDNVTCVIADVTDTGSGIETPLIGGAAAEPTRSEPAHVDTAPTVPPVGPDDAYPVKERHIGRRLAAVAAVVVILVAAAVAGTAVYIDHQWYVAPSAGRVAVFHGVKGSVAGHKLNSVKMLTDLPTSALPQDDRDRLTTGIKTSSLTSANQVVTNLRGEACPTPTATPAPTTSPTATPAATHPAGKTGTKRSHKAGTTPATTIAPMPTLPAWCPASR